MAFYILLSTYNLRARTVLTKFYFLLICALLISGCDGAANEPDMISKVVVLQLGDTQSDLIKRLGLDEKRNINHQPVGAGVNFYEQDFKSGNMPTFRFEHGVYSFELPNLYGYVATEALKNKVEGIVDIDVYWLFRNQTGISIPHNEARLTMIALLNQLTNLGWRNMQFYSDPRLLGDESYQYRDIDLVYSPDPTVQVDIDTWLKLRAGSIWRLQADGVILEIGFQRQPGKVEPVNNAHYLLSIKVYPVESYAKSNFKFEDREQWQELWVEQIKRLKTMRYQKEAELIKQGYHIDTSYQDPLVHPADPVEPDMEE